MQAGSPLHPLRHSFLVCVQLRLADQPPSQSDIPLAYKPSWATGEVFGLRALLLLASKATYSATGFSSIFAKTRNCLRNAVSDRLIS
jgi:hypothetical protein